ncbi:hypothetical protein [Lentzea flava]|uniref:RsbT co-antagonist protein rsbRD N-terminal domain-containing protein n=1 Tax=Lentzea flava TaxID=103732 RepID=A0ABQ2UJ26_9PSEU|nr:hypothetical protein [Lentzea flava]MCP2199899.1 hypothetical protein [Lentzea flava]GGU40110.1 hypothetical protein GCM10010178_35630 [Lentzea flava]
MNDHELDVLLSSADRQFQLEFLRRADYRRGGLNAVVGQSAPPNAEPLESLVGLIGQVLDDLAYMSGRTESAITRMSSEVLAELQQELEERMVSREHALGLVDAAGDILVTLGVRDADTMLVHDGLRRIRTVVEHLFKEAEDRTSWVS